VRLGASLGRPTARPDECSRRRVSKSGITSRFRAAYSAGRASSRLQLPHRRSDASSETLHRHVASRRISSAAPFSKARQLAEAWVAIITDGDAEIVRKRVEAKSYGWIFVYESSAYLRDRTNFSARLVGNAPFIVDRMNGEIRVVGTGPRLQTRLTEYERGLPATIWEARPEAPQW
jgi:hypothetical protein